MFINTMEKLSQRINEYFGINILDYDIIKKVLNTLPRYYESLSYSIKVQMDTDKGLLLSKLKENLITK